MQLKLNRLFTLGDDWVKVISLLFHFHKRQMILNAILDEFQIFLLQIACCGEKMATIMFDELTAIKNAEERFAHLGGNDGIAVSRDM